MKKYLSLDYLYLFLCIAWVPLQTFVLKVDGAGRTLAALAVVIIFLNINKKVLWQFMSEKPYRYWCLWLIFSFVNAAVITKVQGEPLVFFFNILHPLMMLFLVYKKHELQIERLINVAIIGLYFYLFLIFIFYSGALLMNRGATGDLNPNAIALNAVALLFLTCLKFQLGRLTLNKFLVL